MPASEEFLTKQYAAKLLGFRPITNTPKEAHIMNRTPAPRYRYTATIEIDALDGETGKTSSASTLAEFLQSNIVWQRAGERNVKASVLRERIESLLPPVAQVADLPESFEVVNKQGMVFPCIKVGGVVIVNGTTGLHKFSAALVQSHLNSGSWVVR